MSHARTNRPHETPCVVQVGFAGARRLCDEEFTDPNAERSWHDAVEQHLAESLDALAKELRLSPHHFLCGISQIACGADTLFTRACRTRQIRQRIFLPQPADDYLSAAGSSGLPDFTPEQRAEAESLLASKHIIQQRVVSASLNRTERFQETNAEILRVSDVVICLLRENSRGESGGANDLLDRARAIGVPALEIRVGSEHSRPVFDRKWHIDRERPFVPPTIPEPLDRLDITQRDLSLLSSEEYCGPLKSLVSTQAKGLQKFFRLAAALILLTHVGATLLATLALAFHSLHGHEPHAVDASSHAVTAGTERPENHQSESSQPADVAGDSTPPHTGSFFVRAVPWLLGLELVLLVAGQRIHHVLHRSRAVRIWANARVAAELVRSIRAIHPRHIYLEHLFQLPLPRRFRPLLRTLSVLHLHSTYENRGDPWQPVRNNYLEKRITHQIGYFEEHLEDDSRSSSYFRKLFTLFTLLALAATAAKLVLVITTMLGGGDGGAWPLVLGGMAIVLPVMAVAALSWAAAIDCEARAETFRETLDFLHRRAVSLPHADTAAEFDRLLLETESVLLGEVANWFSRRANTSVT